MNSFLLSILLAAGVCCFFPKTSSGQNARERATAVDLTVRIGDSEAEVVRKLGRPTGSMKHGQSKQLLYSSGEITIENGKVVSMTAGFQSGPAPARTPAKTTPPQAQTPKSSASKTPAPPKSPPAATAKSSSAPATASAKPKAGKPGCYETNNFKTLPGLSAVIPDYEALEQKVRDAVARNNLTVTDEELRTQIYNMWKACFTGGGAPIYKLKYEMGRFWNDAATETVDTTDAQQRMNDYRYASGSGWAYSKNPPGPDSSDVWKKFHYEYKSINNTSGGYQFIGHLEGDFYDWRKVKWDDVKKCWTWKTAEEWNRFFDGYAATLNQDMIDWRNKVDSDLYNTRKEYKQMLSLIQAFEPDVKHRYIQLFINDYRNVPYPMPDDPFESRF